MSWYQRRLLLELGVYVLSVEFGSGSVILSVNLPILRVGPVLAYLRLLLDNTPLSGGDVSRYLLLKLRLARSISLLLKLQTH